MSILSTRRWKAALIAGSGFFAAALQALTYDLIRREREREDGALVNIERAMSDALWGLSPDLSSELCRHRVNCGGILPAQGRCNRRRLPPGSAKTSDHSWRSASE